MASDRHSLGSREGRAAVALLAAALAFASLPLEAAAERCPDAAEASRHKRRGWKLRQADPEAAAAEFQKAHELCPDPWYLGHMAAAYEKAGRIRDAIAAIDGYIGYEKASHSEEALEARRRLEAMLARIEIESDPPGASILVDGEPPGRRARAPLSVEVDPGVHVIEASHEDYRSAQEEVDVDVGEERRLVMTLRPLVERREDEPPPPPTPDEPEGRGWTGAIGLAIGGAFPVSSELLGSSLLLALDVTGGYAWPLLRFEGLLQLVACPDVSGAVVQLAVGPRLGIKLGGLPLFLDVELPFGLVALVVSAEGRRVPQGTTSTFGLSPALSLTWAVASSVEIIARPIRLEVSGLGAADLAGPIVRYALDLGVRYRF